MRLVACVAWMACFGLIALGMTRFERPPATASHGRRAQQIDGCSSCHVATVEQYVKTAHFRTSMGAGVAGVLGRAPAQVMTSVPTTRFRVERRDDGIHQVATWLVADRALARSERIDLVVGSGRRGQSYLYWKDGLLYQLPLSYLVAGHRWINSPGYTDGEVHFDRVIPPRCLECHATSFRLEGVPPHVKYAADYELGIACQVCHGRAREHRRPGSGDGLPVGGIANPARLTRQQQIDLCALCHAGADRELRRAPFTFTPGDRLADHLEPSKDSDKLEPDVHGNQVALLAASRCFQQSPTMTCSTCHDVHETERDARQLSTHCIACHAPEAAGKPNVAGALPERHPTFAGGVRTCVDCHMPLQPSRLIRMVDGDRTLAPSYRTHRIAIYSSVGRPEARDAGDERQTASDADDHDY